MESKNRQLKQLLGNFLLCFKCKYNGALFLPAIFWSATTNFPPVVVYIKSFKKKFVSNLIWFTWKPTHASTLSKHCMAHGFLSDKFHFPIIFGWKCSFDICNVKLDNLVLRVTTWQYLALSYMIFTLSKTIWVNYKVRVITTLTWFVKFGAFW
jgi:hypothetical protein